MKLLCDNTYMIIHQSISSLSSSSLSTSYPYLSSSFYRREEEGRVECLRDSIDGWIDGCIYIIIIIS
jgi:hypothetical protein